MLIQLIIKHTKRLKSIVVDKFKVYNEQAQKIKDDQCELEDLIITQYSTDIDVCEFDFMSDNLQPNRVYINNSGKTYENFSSLDINDIYEEI